MYIVYTETTKLTWRSIMATQKAHIAGAAASAGVGGSMIGATAALTGPTANLGGYAVAQMAAGSVGLGGPALSAGIAAVGGPFVVGAALTAGVGYGVYRLFKWFS